MAEININFDNVSYSFDDSALSAATEKLETYLSSVVSEEGVSVTFNGVNYIISDAEIEAAKNSLTEYLGTIGGDDSKVVIDGVEYGIDATKISGAVAGLHEVLEELEAGGGGDEPSGDLPPVGTSLEDCTWAQISAISAAGRGEEYFNIGDTKSVYLKGTVGTLELDTTLYVYIIGFNHNSEVEGNGITFGTFKTADGINVALCDSNCGERFTDGTKCFNMNHWGSYNWGSYNYGGWAASDIRYDILGSTDVAPSNYGSARTTSDVGYDATSTCATNPVDGTLMAALPMALRAVMKPMTIYTDNTGNESNIEASITATVDYLPLLAEYEIFGTRSKADNYEKNKQAQYAYYTAGNSKKKYRHSAIGSACSWWERSPCYSYYLYFCRVTDKTSADFYTADASYGLAPIFKV